MTKEDFQHVQETIQEDTKNFLEENDRVTFLIRDLKTGQLHFAGSDCVACLYEYLKLGIETGAIKHKGEYIKDGGHETH